MEYTKLGRIRPVYKGAWSASAAYTALDIVKTAAGDRAYIALKDVPKGAALTDAAYWGAVLDVSDVLAAADAAISAANEAARLAPKPLTLTEKSHPAVIWPEEGSLLRPTVSMLPVQSGSGDPSPDNVRPISGRTAVTVTRCGKNLLKNSAVTTTANGITYTVNADGSIVCNGTSVDSAFTFLISNEKLPAGNYILSGCPAGGSSSGDGAYRLQADITMPDGKTMHVSDHGDGASFTLEETPKAMYVFTVMAKNGTHNNLTFKPMIRQASEVNDAYQPYRGDAYTFVLGDAVYGGTMDLSTGELTVDKKGITLDGSEDWTMVSAATNGLAYYYCNIGLANTINADRNTQKCSHYAYGEVVSWNSIQDKFRIYTPDGGSHVRLSIRPDIAKYPTLDLWKAFLAGQSVTVVCELTEPVTVQLSPVEIAALEGLNTVYSTGDGMELTYNKSLAREHEELLARIAALEAAAVNNA